MILFFPKLGNWESWGPWMSCEGQCGKKGIQTRTRVCNNGNCVNATEKSVEIKAGCTATATCTGCYSIFIAINWVGYKNLKFNYISNHLN